MSLRRTATLMLLVLAAGAFWCAAPRAASAHSELLSTQPAFGDKLPAVTEFVLTYDDRVDLHGSSAQLVGGGGKKFRAGKLAFAPGSNKVVTVAIPDLPKGGYRFSWLLTGDDGHVEGGEVVFSVDPSAPAVAAPAPAPPAPGPAAPGPKLSRFAPASPVAPVTPGTLPGVNESRTAAEVLGLGPGSDGTLPDTPRSANLSGDVLPEEGTDDELATAAIVSPVRIGTAGLATVSTTTRFVGFTGLALLVGGLALVAVFWPAGAALPRARRLLWAGLLAALAATALTFGLTGAGLRGLGPFDALRPSVAGTVMGSHMGGVLTARLVFLLLALPALAFLAVNPERTARSGWWRALTLGSVAGAIATYGLTGHPYSEGKAASAAAIVHVVAAFAWLGGLVFLLAVVLPRRRGDEVLRLVPAFSRLAGGAVAVMALSGTLLLVLIRPDWGSLLGSGYGRFLAFKLLLVAILLLVASKARRFTHRVLLARSAEGGFVRLTPLVTACAVEVVLAVGVLSATAVLVGRAPPT